MVKMKKKLVIIGLFFTVMLISFFMSLGCVGKDEEQKKLSEEDITQMVRQTPVVIGEEKVGGKYNASILTVRTEYKGNVQTWHKIEYTKNNKTIRDDFVAPDIRNALEWIKINTPQDAVIMGWWDYGRSIEGYTGRGVVVETLSKEMLPTVAEYLRMPPELQREAEKKMEKKGVPHENIMDVAKAFTTKNSQEAIEIMKKYNASYLFIYKRDDLVFSFGL